MRARSAFVLGLGSLVLGGVSWAVTRTVFDFESVGPHQVGAYDTSPEVVLQDGTARLAERSSPAWALSDWSFRVPITVDNPTGQALADYPVRVDLSVMPVEFFDRARWDGADIVVVDTGGNRVEPWWIEWFDFVALRGTLWFRPASLQPGTSVFYVYFGNPDWEDPGDAESLFSYQDLLDTYVVTDTLSATSTLAIESFVDGNQVHAAPSGTTLSLGLRGTAALPADDMEPGTLLSSLGPFSGVFDGDGTDAPAPLVFAATRFAYPAPRYQDIVAFYAPSADATVIVSDRQTVVATAFVPAGQAVEVTADVADGHGLLISSDEPVVVVRKVTTGTAFYDAMVFVPPDTELVGANSGNGRVVALEDGTTVEVFDSNEGYQIFTLDAGETAPVGAPGNQGSGPAVHILASAPVAALSYGDGDGGESVTFLPRKELGRRYLVPRQAQYVLVGSPSAGVTCEIVTPDGQVAQTARSDVLAPEYPNRLYFTNVAAGSELSCDAPVFAMMEDSATNDEKNLWPMKVHRPEAGVSVSLGGQVESRFPTSQGWVTTPTLQPERGVARYVGFYELAARPPGTDLRYQLSVDEGQSWLYYDGQQWSLALTASQSNRAAQVGRFIRELDAAGKTLTVRALLSSRDGTVTPVLDDLAVDFVGPGEALSFVFDTIDGTQIAGRPFAVSITALDASGLVATSFNGQVELSTLHGTVTPETSPPFQAGRLVLDLAVTEVGPSVRLVARDGAVFGVSDPFPVVAPPAEDLVFEKVSGDQQVGEVGQALTRQPTVRVVDTVTGNGAPSVDVRFQVLEGGGFVAGPSEEQVSSLTVATDADGFASVVWTLGPEPGPNVLEASVEDVEGSPVRFEARADPPGAKARTDEYWASGGGGCSCRSQGSGPTDLLLLIGLLGIALVRWRRMKR